MRIRYFAWLRERLNRNEDEIQPPAEVRTVADLIDWLRKNDEAADLAMEKPHLIRAAVDGRLAAPETLLAGAALVALFPPMTGG